MDQPPAEIHITAVAYHGERHKALVTMQRHYTVGLLCDKLRSQFPNPSWGDVWLPSEPVEYSEVWKKSIERGGLEKWCTRLYFPKALRELKLHSSTNPDHVDILFTLPSKQERFSLQILD